MAQELELKYAATEAQLQQLQTHYGGFTPITMETTYYDTPGGLLSQSRITLRCRLENGMGVCTVKAPGQGSARGEWETPGTDIAGAIPELCKLGAPQMLLPLPTLIPVCGARFTRLARMLPLSDGEAELALDRGVLLGGGRELPFCEVELELKSGSEAGLTALAEAIAAAFSLTPEPRSKFQRAHELSLTG